MLSTRSTIISFSVPLDVSITVPSGKRGSFASSFSRIVLRMLKVALWDIPSAPLYSTVRRRKPPNAVRSHGR